MSSFLRCASVLFALSLVCSPVFARDIYVAMNGDEINPGTSELPYRLIKGAVNRAVSGDVIHVRTGTYYETNISLKSNLTLISEDGPYTAKINSSFSSGLRMIGVTNVEVRGFELMANYGQGSAGDGLLRIYNASNIRIKDCLVHDAPYDCDVVKIGGFGTATTNTLIENCVIYNPAPTVAGGHAQCLDAHPVDGLTVRNCWIYHTAGKPADMLIRANGGSKNVVFENNIFGPSYDNGVHAPAVSAGVVDSDTPQVPSVDGMIVRNNVLMDCQGSGAFSVISSKNVKFYNNVIYNYLGTGAAVSFRNASTAANQSLDFCNNIVCNTNGKPAFIALGAYTPGAFTHDYNLYWQVAAGGFTDVTLEPHSLFVDPEMVLTMPPMAGAKWADYAAAFRLQADSPAINAGLNLGAVGVTSDLFSDSRPVGSGYDIGAHEFAWPGDITRDGKVNVFDLQRLAASWNKQLGDAAYDPECDLTGDNKVNVFDLQIMAGNWNKSVP